ncbi:MAG: PAS domain S-box protein [Thermodesulfobacteriota bacterium]
MRRLWLEANDIFFRLDLASGRFDYISPAVSRVFGWPLPEVLQTPHFILEVLHPQDRDQVRAWLESCLRRGVIDNTLEVFRARRRDGRDIYIHHKLRGIHDQNGHLTHVEGIARDATDLVNLHQEMKRILDELPGLVVRLDGGLRITWANRRWLRLLGRRLEDLLGREGVPFMATADGAGELLRTLAGLEMERPAASLAPLVLPGREDQTVIIWRFVVMAQPGGGREIICLGQDVTEQVAAQAALQQASQELGKVVSLLDRAPVMASRSRWTRERRMDVEYVNRGSETLFGYTPEEIKADPGLTRRILPDPWFQHYYSLAAQFLATAKLGDSITTEYGFVRKDGSPGWARHTAWVADVDPVTQELAVEAVIHDITELKQVEQALRQSEQEYRQSHARLQALLENTSDLISINDEVGRPIIFNSAYRQVMREALGIQVRPGLRPHTLLPDPRDRAFWEELHRRVLSGEKFRADFSLVVEPHGKRFFDVSYSPIVEEGEVKGFCEITRDITEHKQAEQTLRQMTAGMAHNFNNLLAAVLGNAQAVQQMFYEGLWDPAQAAELMANVVESARAGVQLVQRLAACAATRAEPDQQPNQVVDAAEIAERALRIAGRAWPGQGAQGLRLESRVPRALWVRSHPGALLEVFLNLAKNALEAMAGCGMLMVDGQAREGWAVLRFVDQGPGMDAETALRAFEPFFSTKHGSGLGLPSSRGILRSLGGDLTLHTQPGQGCQVIVTLPLAPAPRPAAKPSAPAKARWERVLLLEDEALVALGIEALLAPAGYRLRWSTRLEEALAVLAEFAPQAVLCDLGLPDGNGWDLARAAARLVPRPAIILLTGWGREQADAWAGDDPVEVDAVLHKPVERNHLLSTLAQTLDRRRPAAR